MRFGENLRKLRKSKKLSQEDLAEKMNVLRQSVSGKQEFPKQKDIKEQPVFTCLQRKEYCY